MPPGRQDRFEALALARLSAQRPAWLEGTAGGRTDGRAQEWPTDCPLRKRDSCLNRDDDEFVERNPEIALRCQPRRAAPRTQTDTLHARPCYCAEKVFRMLPSTTSYRWARDGARQRVGDSALSRSLACRLHTVVQSSLPRSQAGHCCHRRRDATTTTTTPTIMI